MDKKYLKEGIQEIHRTRATLGGMTLRESMEAIYGLDYTTLALGENGGNNITINELSIYDELLKKMGLPTSLKNNNRLPSSNTSPAHSKKLNEALDAQISYTEEETEKSAFNFHKFLSENT